MTSARFVTLCLGSLALLSLGGAWQLSWTEYVRLALIGGGLVWMYLTIRRGGAGHAGPAPVVERYFPHILAAAFIFLITQFDPATSRVGLTYPRDPFNWYFWISSLLAGLAFGATAVSAFRGRAPGWGCLDAVDKLVLTVCVGTVLLSAAVGLVFDQAVESSAVRWGGGLKVAAYLMLWFATTRSLRPAGADPPSVRSAAQVLLAVVLLVFAGVGVVGLYRTTTTWFTYSKGQALFKAEEYSDALSHYQRARRANRTLDLAWIRRGCWSALLALYRQRGDQGGVEEVVAEVATYYDRGHDCGFVGDMYYEAGLWEQAIPSYKEALRGGYSDQKTIDKLAFCYLRTNNRTALVELVKGFKYIPGLPATTYDEHMLLGESSFSLGALDRAFSRFERAAALSPDHDLAPFKMGQVRLAQGDPRAAMGHFRRAVQLNAGFAEAHYQLGVCYERLEQTRQAYQAYRAALEVVPGHLKALQALGALTAHHPYSFDHQRLEQYTPSIRLAYTLGGYVELLGIDVGSPTIAPGQSVEIIFYWRLSRDLLLEDSTDLKRFSVKFFVYDGNLRFLVAFQSPLFRPGLKQWRMGEVIKQEESFSIPEYAAQVRRNGVQLNKEEARRIPLPRDRPCEIKIGLRREWRLIDTRRLRGALYLE